MKDQKSIGIVNLADNRKLFQLVHKMRSEEEIKRQQAALAEGGGDTADTSTNASPLHHTPFTMTKSNANIASSSSPTHSSPGGAGVIAPNQPLHNSLAGSTATHTGNCTTTTMVFGSNNTPYHNASASSMSPYVSPATNVLSSNNSTTGPTRSGGGAAANVERYEKPNTSRVQTYSRPMVTPQRRPTPLKHTNSVNALNRGNEDEYSNKGSDAGRAQTALRSEYCGYDMNLLHHKSSLLGNNSSTNNNNSNNSVSSSSSITTRNVNHDAEDKTRKAPGYKTPLRPASRRGNASPTPFSKRANDPIVSSSGISSNNNSSIANSSSSTGNSAAAAGGVAGRHRMSRITVVIRKRPLSEGEVNAKLFDILATDP
uniref:Uncharacterized protein n=1 Tax=Lygus hesperus TaxID=30085 RepID=A0A0A9WIN4_LYGHE